MNKLTKTLLILPIIALTSVGSAKAEPIIETTGGPVSFTVNCTDNLIFDSNAQKWRSRSESVSSFFDAAVTQACGN